MNRTRAICLLLICLFSVVRNKAYSQTKAGQQAQIIGYNIGFGIVTTTVGSLINKPKYAPAWPYIKKSLWQGALGGALQYSGKALTYQITRTGNDWWGWGSKIVHSAGNSICLNASQNYRFGQFWVLDYGPARLNFMVDKGRLNFQPQFNLLFIYDLLENAHYGGRMDWKRTLHTGTVSFQADGDLFLPNGSEFAGISFTRSTLFAQHIRQSTPGHELVHVYQANEYRVMNTYFNPLVAKINNKAVKGIFKYVYVELPYFGIAYSLIYNRHSTYYRNYYEFEAEALSTNAYVNRDRGF